MTPQITSSLTWAVIIICIIILASSIYIYNSRKRHDYDFSDRILVFAFAVCAVAPFFTYIFIILAKYFLSEFMYPIGVVNDWITLIGSIFGGFITLSAVIFTKISTQEDAKKQIESMQNQVKLLSDQNELIKQQHKDDIRLRKQEMANQIVPILKVTFDDQIELLIRDECSRAFEKDKTDRPICIVVPFVLVNVTDNIARSIQVLGIRLSHLPNESSLNCDIVRDESIFKEEFSSIVNDISIIPGKADKPIRIPIEIEFRKEITFEIEIMFSDVMEYRTYIVKSMLRMTINPSNSRYGFTSDIDPKKIIVLTSSEYEFIKQGV